MKNITEFKRGDIITRIIPATNGDRSYMGDELVFIGVANARIYFRSNNRFSKIVFGDDRIFDVPEDLWTNGWAKWVDPKTLLEGEEHIISSLSIEEQINEAIKREDYELAEKLKRLLK